MDSSPASSALKRWQSEAERGKDASFTGWTFFDTCCLSELVKLTNAGEGERVRAFVSGRDIVIPLTVIQELRRAPTIADQVPNVLETGNVYGFPHPAKFWDCDLWNFLNSESIRRNVLEAFPVSAQKIRFQAGLPDVVFARAEQMAGAPFLAQIERDRKENVHEAKLVSMVWGKVNELAQDQYRIKIPPADCRPENFPALFTFYYAYYHRFLVQRRVVPEPNDFIDLAQASIAPYCKDFYAEQKLVQRLRKQVQEKRDLVPTPFQVSKRIHKDGYIDAKRLEQLRRSEDMKQATSPLLANTNLVTHMEMRAAILAI